VLGAVTAQLMGIDRIRPGMRIWVGPGGMDGQWFYVTGILNSTTYAPEIDSAVLVGFPAAEKYLHFDGHPSEIYVRTTENDQAVTTVDGLLGAQANPESPGQVEVSHHEDRHVLLSMPEGTGLTLCWMPLLGAHVDSSGGLHLAYERAEAMGAQAIQVHPTPPGFWGSPKLDEARIATFKDAAEKHGRPPFYFHAVYLINLAGDDPTLRQRSESTLAGYLKAADDLGVNGVIFHTGSHKGAGFEARLPSIVEHLEHVLERANPSSARLLIENNAGLGGCVGARFEEIAQMLSAIDDPRVSVCFDTCHAFASGYDERSPAEVSKTLDELDRVIGLSHVEVIHCNDSVTGLGSNRDRHANIGAGEIGEAGFRALLHEPRLARLPFILEVPGAGDGPDAEQIAVLKRLSA